MKPSLGPAIRAGFQPASCLPPRSRGGVRYPDTLLSSLQRGFSNCLQAPVPVLNARCLKDDEQVRLKPADQHDWIRDPPTEAGGRQAAG